MGVMEFNHGVEEVFQSACVDLFKSLNCSVACAKQNECHLYDAPVACIDAGSNDVELILGLQMPMAVLALTYPLTESIVDVGEESLEDWISELSNQLIGRVKSKLSAQEGELKLGLPVTYYGEDHSELMQQDEKIALYFNLEGEVCACYLSVEVLVEGEVLANYFLQEEEDAIRGELELF